MSAREAPLIGVTGPDRGGTTAWVFTWLAIRRAGGRALRITPKRRRLTQMLDGLVIGGGADVADSLPDVANIDALAPPSKPGHWWRWVIDALVAMFVLIARWLLFWRDHEGGDPRRDELEAGLLRDAMARDLPVLGICRGSQLMALVAGGALVRDVAAHHEGWVEMWTPLPRREVLVEAGTRLHAVYGQQRIIVNSLHHDAVARIEAPARPCAHEPLNGVIYAIDDPSRAFWLGVQWHPEYMPQRALHQRLFHALVEAAAEAADDVAAARAGREPEPRAGHRAPLRPHPGAAAPTSSGGRLCRPR